MLKKYQINRVRLLTRKETKERIAAKMRKKVRIGDKDFDSIVESARYLKRDTNYVKYYINKGNLPDGTPIFFNKGEKECPLIMKI